MRKEIESSDVWDSEFVGTALKVSVFISQQGNMHSMECMHSMAPASF